MSRRLLLYHKGFGRCGPFFFAVYGLSIPRYLLRFRPLNTLSKLTTLSKCLVDSAEPSSQKRAENTIIRMIELRITPSSLNLLPLGILDWPLEAYCVVGLNDVAASASQALFGDGYKAVKDFILSGSISALFDHRGYHRIAGSGEVQAASGVELDLDDFTDIRFGQDRRLEDADVVFLDHWVNQGYGVTGIEHDQAKDHQHQVLQIAERMLALPCSRAMFTFGSLATVTREAYNIPKMEFAIRLQPLT
ncbi:hypothetical protein B0H13DRAFT_2342012 [Mycena leptocephala]|nr:hypothetical protein B0H13DRAFT_2342012 [Mycena leptocephala]